MLYNLFALNSTFNIFNSSLNIIHFNQIKMYQLKCYKKPEIQLLFFCVLLLLLFDK